MSLDTLTSEGVFLLKDGPIQFSSVQLPVPRYQGKGIPVLAGAVAPMFSYGGPRADTGARRRVGARQLGGSAVLGWLAIEETAMLGEVIQSFQNEGFSPIF